ncbi:Sn-glycerol-3-phosphate ABC transporter ATP-binding protein [Erwinia tracheiphila PSU-1]|nr:Sn-glycerol-3-phosphate ABC transporter ATP-binding protein [Erwinia tracheiphila PSU-1]
MLSHDGTRLTLTDDFAMPLPVIRADWAGRTLTLGGRPGAY